MAGLPTRAGLGGPGVVAAADAPAVARLRAAGMTLLGKARMDEAACGATGDNPHHGRTENPRAPGHSPGGSSGGCAAAIAAGLCDGAIGTDTLGSVRIPAAYCGVVGLKPTRGLISTEGVVPLSWTLDHVGLLGANVEVVGELLALFLPRERAAGPLRVGVLDDACGAVLGGMGWTLEPCRIDGWDPVATRRAGLLVLEAEGAVIHAGLLESADPAMSPGVRSMLAYGRDCGSGRLLRALHVLQQAADGLDGALERCAMIALPTVATPAFAWNDGPPAGQADLTALANAGGHPAISVPIGATTGLQLIGRRGADWTLVNAAQRL